MDLIIQLGWLGGACLVGDDSWMAEGLPSRTHTHTQKLSPLNLTDSPCQWTLSIPPLFPLQTQFPLPTAASLETWVKSSAGTWWQGWNLIETAPNWWRVRGATDQLSVAWFKIDEALNCLSLSPGWVCVLGLIRPLSWRGRKSLPVSNKVNPYLS